MPKAYYHAGYIVGSFGTIIIGSIAVYCIQLLLKIHYELCKRNKVCLVYNIQHVITYYLEVVYFKTLFRSRVWIIQQ